MPNALLPETGNRADWDRQYRDGDWDYLTGRAEAARYGILARIIRENRAGSVLDLGCGHGQLYEQLGGSNFEGNYLGIDWSPSALSRIQTDPAKHNFVCADVRQLPVRAFFDFIVLTEVLYYLDDPIGTIDDIRSWLTGSSQLLVTMYQPNPERRPDWHRTVNHIQQKLALKFDSLSKTMVEDPYRGRKWTLTIIRGKAPIS